MKIGTKRLTRLTAWAVCFALVCGLLPVSSVWETAPEGTADITPDEWALTANGWNVKYDANAVTKNDGKLSFSVQKENSYDAAHRLESPRLTTPLGNVKAVQIDLKYTPSSESGKSGLPSVQLDVCYVKDIADFTDSTATNSSNQGWGSIESPALQSGENSLLFTGKNGSTPKFVDR